VAHDRVNRSRAKGTAGQRYVFDEGAAARAMQHFGLRGFQPRAFSCGQDNHN
jgi:hypothetical protein